MSDSECYCYRYTCLNCRAAAESTKPKKERPVPSAAPDPGEVWRLLDKGEEIRSGDEFYALHGNWIAVREFLVGQPVSGTDAPIRRRETIAQEPARWLPIAELTGESRYVLVAHKDYHAARVYHNSRARLSIAEVCFRQEGYEPTHFCELPVFNGAG